MDVSNENPIFDVSESGLEVFFSHQETSLRRPSPVLVRLGAVLEPLGPTVEALCTHLRADQKPSRRILKAAALRLLPP